MFSQIFDAIEEWMRELLTGMITSNLDTMFTDVNQKTGEIATQVGQTPQGWNGSIFSMIRNLSDSVIMPIAGIIITLVLCYELISMLTERNNMHDIDTWMFFKYFVKMWIAVYLVSNTFTITMAVFDVLHCMTRISQQECRGILELKEDMKMSENNDYIQLPPLKKDTPADVVAFMWEYMKVPEDSREKVKNLLKDANENGVKISHQAPTLYDVVPKEEIAEFEELMRKTIADIVSEASSVACWVYVQKYVKHKTLNEMLQELPDVGQFILAMDTWFEKLMEK